MSAYAIVKKKEKFFFLTIEKGTLLLPLYDLEYVGGIRGKI
jgi:hypothetical protein